MSKALARLQRREQLIHAALEVLRQGRDTYNEDFDAGDLIRQVLKAIVILEGDYDSASGKVESEEFMQDGPIMETWEGEILETPEAERGQGEKDG